MDEIPSVKLLRLGFVGGVADGIPLDSTTESKAKLDPDIESVEDSTPVNSRL